MDHLKKFFLAGLGTAIVIVGVAGCFLPVIPGIAIILLGLTVMGKQALFLDPLRQWLDKRQAAKAAAKEQKSKVPSV